MAFLPISLFGMSRRRPSSTYVYEKEIKIPRLDQYGNPWCERCGKFTDTYLSPVAHIGTEEGKGIVFKDYYHLQCSVCSAKLGEIELNSAPEPTREELDAKIQRHMDFVRLVRIAKGG